MAEWTIAAVLKTAVPRGTGGSNPSPSADAVADDLTVLEHRNAQPSLQTLAVALSGPQIANAGVRLSKASLVDQLMAQRLKPQSFVVASGYGE